MSKRTVNAFNGEYQIKVYKYDDLSLNDKEYLESCGIFNGDGLIATELFSEGRYEHFLNGLTLENSDEDIASMINKIY